MADYDINILYKGAEAPGKRMERIVRLVFGAEDPEEAAPDEAAQADALGKALGKPWRQLADALLDERADGRLFGGAGDMFCRMNDTELDPWSCFDPLFRAFPDLTFCLGILTAAPAHIPDGVTEIGYRAFDGCSSLTEAHIPDSVTKIGDGAFCECAALAEISVPKGAKIGKGAFKGCAGTPVKRTTSAKAAAEDAPPAKSTPKPAPANQAKTAADSAKRTFVYTDEKTSKFWSIEVNGASYTVNYGKTGANGQTQEKSFDSEEACRTAADKVIAEKVKKGYAEEKKRQRGRRAE
jgi:predicted DNA-binding WGR domain protein